MSFNRPSVRKCLFCPFQCSVCVCVYTGGTWWGSRARWWATSLSPSTSRASSWAACITLIISLGPCTSASLTSNTCPSNSPSTGPCSAVYTPHHLSSAFTHTLHTELTTNPRRSVKCGKALCWNLCHFIWAKWLTIYYQCQKNNLLSSCPSSCCLWFIII